VNTERVPSRGTRAWGVLRRVPDSLGARPPVWLWELIGVGAVIRLRAFLHVRSL
jgi:hypothetical protein